MRHDRHSPHRSCLSGTREEGQAIVGLVPAVLVLIAALALVLPTLGDAVNSRTEQRTAADAAALAAGTAFAEELHRRWRLPTTIGSTPPHLLLDQPVDRLARERVVVAARRFAQAGGADLVGFAVRPMPAGVEYEVQTRSQRPVYGSHEHTHARAVARVVLRRGLCVREGNRLLGVLASSGRCLSRDEWTKEASGRPFVPSGGAAPSSSATAVPQEPGVENLDVDELAVDVMLTV
ncbi:MAG: pilus assembly protein TadG-related protein [Angustibacter sp.]